jgi:transposase
MTTEDLFILLFCTIDDWLQAQPLPPRPGPRPACSDSEVLTLAVARELLRGRSERSFLRTLRREWRHLFPHLPAQSEFNRRCRWLQGALELLRRHLTRTLTSATSTLLGVDTSPLPIKHRTRVWPGRQPGCWDGPHELRPGFGYCDAKRWWFYGFRLATLAPLSDGVPRHWALTPAGVNEREVAAALLQGEHGVALVADKGFDGAAMRRLLQQQDGILLTPPRRLRRYRPTRLIRCFVLRRRNRVERPYQVLQERLALYQHGAHSLWGLVTRVTAKLVAFTLLTRWRESHLDID